MFQAILPMTGNRKCTYMAWNRKYCFYFNGELEKPTLVVSICYQGQDTPETKLLIK